MGIAPPVRRPDRTKRLLVAASAVMLIAGVAVLGGTGLNWWTRIHRIEVNQASLERTVDARWSRPQPAEPAGGAVSAPIASRIGAQDSRDGIVARLHLPRLGLDLVVVEGSNDADLLRGPGHITGTPLFGQHGNVGIAGHRYPGAFWNLDRLRARDPVVVETADSWYVYRVSREMIVDSSDTGVLAPPPAGAPDMLTLVTCDPVFTTLHRLIRQAALVRTAPRADGPPPELASA